MWSRTLGVTGRTMMTSDSAMTCRHTTDEPPPDFGWWARLGAVCLRQRLTLLSAGPLAQDE